MFLSSEITFSETHTNKTISVDFMTPTNFLSYFLKQTCLRSTEISHFVQILYS